MDADLLATLGDTALDGGDSAAAEEHYTQALRASPGLLRAHVGLAKVRLPGRGYLWWLQRLHDTLRPATYLEIGVSSGESLTQARAGTLAIGVDPLPRIVPRPPVTETCLFPEASDDFFARRALDRVLGERPLDFGFVDGLHQFEQALRDLLNLEAYCGPRSLIAIHDTLPLDELSQRPVCCSGFWTGDVWRTVLCLKTLRPDLDVFTIPAYPSGLTLVQGFGPPRRQPAWPDAAAVARIGALTYEEVEKSLASQLEVVANDWDEIEARLRRGGVLR